MAPNYSKLGPAHKNTNNSSPNNSEGLSILRTAVYERLNKQCNGSDESKCNTETESKVVVINGGNMDLGTNGFTSDVSLPKGKTNKTRAMVNKLQLD